MDWRCRRRLDDDDNDDDDDDDDETNMDIIETGNLPVFKQPKSPNPSVVLSSTIVLALSSFALVTINDIRHRLGAIGQCNLPSKHFQVILSYAKSLQNPRKITLYLFANPSNVRMSVSRIGAKGQFVMIQSLICGLRDCLLHV